MASPLPRDCQLLNVIATSTHPPLLQWVFVLFALFTYLRENGNNMSRLEELIEKLVAFRKERDWEQFHSPKDQAISLALEAAEVLEHFQWKSKEEVAEYLKNHKEDLADELADVLVYDIFMCHDQGIDVLEAIENKMTKNAQKYPVDKAKGTSKKYTEL